MANVDEVLAMMDTPEEAEKVILVIDEDLRVVTIPGIGLVIGAEGDGISRLTEELCDDTVSLPMKGHLDSLNASVAAGIILYHAMEAR